MISGHEQELIYQPTPVDVAAEQFLKDVKSGLTAKPKKLSSKYFYDKDGDALFQQIMQLPEYYLTRSELDIFQNKTADLAKAIGKAPFDLIELGAGDGSKTIHLLEHLSNQAAEFTFMPIDISGNILLSLNDQLKAQIPALSITCLKGDYFDMLDEAVKISVRRKVVLMLGGNIGNMNVDEASAFCKSLFQKLSPGDLVIMGFDLKKNPSTILKAYDDSKGITAAFNLNLLSRINRELGANFNLDQFEHYQTYDPISGDCKSFLVSMEKQQVNQGGNVYRFEKDEVIFMEVSRKFALAEIEQLASASGFVCSNFIFDSKGWFSDVVWEVPAH